LIRLLVAAVVLLLLSSENQTVVLSLSYDEEGIWTEKIEGLLDEETCANLIREAENIGFPKTEVDSIDSYATDVPSLSLDVFFEGDTPFT